VSEGLLAENPAKSLRLPHKYRPTFSPLTPEEARRLLATARGDRVYALYAVALSLGLRRGEALGLRWRDVNLEDGVLTIRESLQRLNGRLVFGPVKSDDSVRSVAMPRPCVEALRRHRAIQKTERETAGKRWKESGVVFASTVGTPIEPRNLNRHFANLLDQAGLRRIRFHDLRHSCATLLYEQGVKIENIQDVLGHSSPTITKTIYVEATRQVQRAAATASGSSSMARRRGQRKGQGRSNGSDLMTFSLVRRQGLEPRTRGLRVSFGRSCFYLAVLDRLTPH